MWKVVSGTLRGLAVAGALAFGYFAMGYPEGWELGRLSTQGRLVALGFVAALLIRSWWSLAFVPFGVIAGAVAAGIASGAITSFRQGVAGAFVIEFFMYGSTALGALLATVLVKLTRRGLRRVSPQATPTEVSSQ